MDSTELEAQIASEGNAEDSKDVPVEDEMEVDSEEDRKVANVRKREDFTSEIYKIEISNMGNFGYGVSKQLKL